MKREFQKFPRRAVLLLFSAAFTLGLAVSASSQTEKQDQAVSAVNPKAAVIKEPDAVAMPAMREFRDISIGTPAVELKKAWGKPAVEDKDGYLYEFSDEELVQVAIGTEKKVDAIAATFRDGTGAPTIESVFGPGVKPAAGENGSVYHLVRYPEAGYWVSYSSQGKGNAVTITFKKI